MSEDMKKYAGHRLPFISTIALDKKGRPNFDTKRAMASYEKAKGIRSSIIDEALMVESKLISVIIAFIFGEHRKSNRREMDLIMSFVFNAEFCTFMLKRKMLSKIFNICGNSIDCISKEDGKKLRRKLNEIILVRNKFAHGQILVDGFTYEPFYLLL